MGSITSKRETRAWADGLGEQGLGVVGQGCGGAELDLNVAVVAREVFDAGVVEEAVVALEVDEDAVARVAGFDLAHGAGEDEMAAMDEGDAVAELLHLVHAVGGEEDGLADAAQIDQGAHEQECVDRVEAAEGLVHEDEVGIVQQRGDELDLLLHSLGEVFGLLGDGLGDVEPLAPEGCAAGCYRGSEAVQLAEEGELIQHVHLLVEAALLRQVSDAAQHGAGEGAVEERDRAGVGDGDADHHADGAGFAGAVGAEQAEHGAGLDGEGEVLHRDLGVVDLADVMQLDDGHGRPGETGNG